mgnify:CR=1 FL=1
MNFLHLTVWSSRARLTSDVVLLCKEAPSTVCWANLRANFVFSHQEVQVSILEQIFLGPLSCPRKLRLVQVPIFPPLSSSLRFPKVARQHRLKIHFEKNSCQNLSQKMFTFFQWISTFQSIYQIYAFFGPLFLLPKVLQDLATDDYSNTRCLKFFLPWKVHSSQICLNHCLNFFWNSQKYSNVKWGFQTYHFQCT